MATPKRGFFATISAAIKDVATNGYSVARIQAWLDEIRGAASSSLVPQSVLAETLNRTLGKIYVNVIEKGDFTKVHPGVSRFTVEKLKPQLQQELARRKAMSADLIKLNRSAMLQKLDQRFSGWASSIPEGGSNAVNLSEVKETVGKPLKQLPFEERRVMIDQGAKFASTLNDIIATDSGAIACIWHSHWRRVNYNYRHDHKDRDLRCYTIRGNWALEKGLMKAGEAGYSDKITQPAEEPFCQCNYQYVYNLRDLPDEMLTQKGRDELARVRAAIKAGL